LSSFVSRTDKYFWIKCSSCSVIFVMVHTVKNIYRKQAFKALALVSKILNLFEIGLYLLWRKVAEIWPNLMLQSLKRTTIIQGSENLMLRFFQLPKISCKKGLKRNINKDQNRANCRCQWLEKISVGQSVIPWQAVHFFMIFQGGLGIRPIRVKVSQ
jgi:hypothetical protein